MSSSKSSREALIKQMRSITNATQNDAQRLLKANGYRLEAAVDAFFQDDAAIAAASKASGSSGEERKKEKERSEKIGKIFDKYKDEDGDDITIDGTMEMCEDLSIQPTDLVMLPLSYYLKCPSLGRFTRSDFIEGWKAIDASADTLEGMKKALSRLEEELLRDAPVRGDRAKEGKTGQGLFKKVYEFTYSFARDEGQKSLGMEAAIAFWEVLIPASPTFAREGSDGKFTSEQLKLWSRFLPEKTNGRAVSKDTWMLFLDFTAEIDAEFEEHDFDAAWPSVIDDFVIWAKENRAKMEE